MEKDPYVALARLSLETYVCQGTVAKVPDGLPKEMLEERAGVFVSLHEKGNLRGCIGTISPQRASVAEEIIQNAISACSEDPRFSPVRPQELEDIEVGVDVLGEAETVGGLADLDPQRYGVIVTHGGRRGLLLPALEGVTTAEQQVDIARQKAGIPRDRPLRLERFEVVRHE